MGDKEEQEEELMALSSIYGDAFKQSETSMGGQLTINLNSEQFVITGLTGDDVRIKYIPPVLLSIDYPADYPSIHAPNFTLTSKWLSYKQLSQLCLKLDSIWEANVGNVVVFLWTDYLQNDLMSELNLTDKLNLQSVITKKSVDDDQRAFQDVASQDLLYGAIVEYDARSEETGFCNSVFLCEICFMEKAGSNCMRFNNCNHTYCKECLAGYFQVQIQDGAVKALTCPSDKCDSQALPHQVRELVDDEFFQRYDRLLLQSSLDTMSDVTYCPRKDCGCGVLSDKESGMGTCSACSYVFCIYCKMGFHGVSPCQIRSTELRALRDRYVEADATQQAELERRYGRKALKKMVEDSYSEDWISEFSKPCPHCQTNIQKVDGCHKMTCTKCRAYFCWLCMARLNAANPYAHFSNPQSSCFNRLFHGMVADEDDGDEWDPQFL